MRFREFLNLRIPVREIISAHYPSFLRLSRIGEGIGVIVRHRWSHRYMPRGSTRKAKFYEGDYSYPSADPQNQRSIPEGFKRLFVVNCRSQDPCVTALPVGTYARRHPWRFAVAGLGTDRSQLAYSNFSMGTGHQPDYAAKRKKVYATLKKNKWITFENIGNRHGRYDLSLMTFYRRLAQHCFTISPEGNGVDCHRTWEALYMKSIPIVQRSPEMEYFSDLPILFTDDYSELTQDYLAERYALMLETEYNIEKLYLSYWRQKIENTISQFSKNDDCQNTPRPAARGA